MSKDLSFFQKLRLALEHVEGLRNLEAMQSTLSTEIEALKSIKKSYVDTIEGLLEKYPDLAVLESLKIEISKARDELESLTNAKDSLIENKSIFICLYTDFMDEEIQVGAFYGNDLLQGIGDNKNEFVISFESLFENHQFSYIPESNSQPINFNYYNTDPNIDEDKRNFIRVSNCKMLKMYSFEEICMQAGLPFPAYEKIPLSIVQAAINYVRRTRLTGNPDLYTDFVVPESELLLPDGKEK